MYHVVGDLIVEKPEMIEVYETETVESTIRVDRVWDPGLKEEIVGSFSCGGESKMRKQSLSRKLESIVVCVKMDTSPTTGSVNTTVAEKQWLAKSSLAFNCKTSAFRKLFPEYVEKYNQQQLAEQTQQTAPESPQESNAKAETEKTVDATMEDSDGGLKERRKNKKQGLPAWIILLLVSAFGVVMALPMLQL
ncbi:hypothetical protein HA466_0261040 [Hirschfeldia incana]|nr:hypothetical protein HA466_0261040 [Hirschfeldia incana]